MTPAAFAFVVSLVLPTFGGPVDVEFRVATLDGCERLRRVVVRQMSDWTMRFEATECKESLPGGQKPADP